MLAVSFILDRRADGCEHRRIEQVAEHEEKQEHYDKFHVVDAAEGRHDGVKFSRHCHSGSTHLLRAYTHASGHHGHLVSGSAGAFEKAGSGNAAYDCKNQQRQGNPHEELGESHQCHADNLAEKEFRGFNG